MTPGAPDPSNNADGPLVITPRLQLPLAELEVRATTGGGPGGQHVNRSATRIELVWNARESSALTAALDPDHRLRVLTRLASRLDSSGAIRLVSGEYRSQLRNRDAALKRLVAIVAQALADPKPRRATRPTRAAVERRLDEKKRRSHIKRERRRSADD